MDDTADNETVIAEMTTTEVSASEETEPEHSADEESAAVLQDAGEESPAEEIEKPKKKKWFFWK